ncbi:MAG TPA: hypothetical protein PLU73_05765 [Bacteroidia bacterium]|nr:hypothetical protein [Bacteroidia bacterium]
MRANQNNQNRILILTGAGFTASNDFLAITTKSLTDLVKSAEFNGIKINGKTPGQYFYDELKAHYSNFEKYNTKEELEQKISAYVNFESILHFLEEVYTVLVPFDAYSNNRGNNASRFSSDNKGMKPAIVQLKPELIYELSETLIRYKDKIEILAGGTRKREINLRYFIRLLYLKIIELISNELNTRLQNQENNKGFNSFMKFMENSFPTNKNLWRIYSLNYDNWISKYYNKVTFSDGFDRFGKEFILYMFEVGLAQNCHFNLHGCINWTIDLKKSEIGKTSNGEAITYEDINKFSDYDTSNDPVIITPIISGYNKATRISYDPFMSFFHMLSFDIANAELMIVIGYGFGDKHINNILQKRNPPILFIDFKKSEDDRKEYVSKAKKTKFEKFKLDTTLNTYIEDEFCEYYFFDGIGDRFYETSEALLKHIEDKYNIKFRE